MKKLLVAVIAAAAFCGAPGFAADMPVKAPPLAAAAAFDWSGTYIGGHIGYQWDRISSVFASGVALPIPTVDSNTGVGGFQIGAQKQWGSLVVGIEAGLTDPFSHPLHPAVFPTSTANTEDATMKDELLWVGGRAGWAMGNWMPYITGGWATAKFTWSHFLLGTNDVNGESRNSGAYIGGGLDAAIAPNWIFGVEYRHYDFKSKLAPAFTPAGVPFPPDDELVHPKIDTVLVRLSYKFGG